MQQQAPQPIDTLYQAYDRGLYKIGAGTDTGNAETDLIFGLLESGSGSTNATAVETSVSNLGSGSAVVSTNQTSGALKAGQTLYNDGKPGYFLGIQDGVAVLSIGESTSAYLTWDGAILTISGTISASTIIGGTIETAATGQRVVISGTDNLQYFYNSTQLVMTIGGATTYAININTSATSNTQNGILVTMNASSSQGILVSSTVGGNGFNYTNNSAVGNRAILISQTSNSNGLASIDITYGGTAEGVKVTANNAGTVGFFANITNTNGSYGMLIQSVGIDAALWISSSQSYCIYASGNAYITYGGSGYALEVNNVGTGIGTHLYTSTSSATSNPALFIEVAGSNASAFAIGTHIKVTNSGNTSLASAVQLEGDCVVSSGVNTTTNTTKVRVNIGGTAYYIPLYTA